MENISVKDVILEKKLDNYSYSKDNLQANGELMVTITLNEYRALIKEVATKQSDIEKANKDKYTRESENEKLKEEVNRLKAECYELQGGLKLVEGNEVTVADEEELK